MAHHPLPVVALATSNGIDTQPFMRAGALTVSSKPTLDASRSVQQFAELRTTIALMAEVKVVTRRPRGPRKPAVLPVTKGHTDILAIGASTGGPSILGTLLAGWEDFPVPVVVAQHISKGFVQGLVDWLDDETALKVEIAQSGVEPRSGHVYFAPDDYQFGFAA